MSAHTAGFVAILGLLVCAPAAAAAGPPARDLLKDAVDPYAPGLERVRFFAAAGVDGELDGEEFLADASKPDPFVRPFDRWDLMRKFDKNANQTLDWLEADAYRLATQKRLLATYDRNKDGRLDRAERDAANRGLAKASPQRGIRNPSARRAGPDATGAPPYYRPDYAALYRQADRDGDGRLAGPEAQAYQAAIAEGRKRWELGYYDLDGDGKLSRRERGRIYQDRRNWRQHLRQAADLKRYDTNRDGRLDERERAAQLAGDARREQALQHRQRMMLKRWDRDEDGRLSRSERAARAADHHRRWAEQRKLMDTNRDGTISPPEAAAFRKKLLDQYDMNKDADLDEEEKNKVRDAHNGLLLWPIADNVPIAPPQAESRPRQSFARR